MRRFLDAPARAVGSSRRQHGFSLMELLLVVAVIGLGTTVVSANSLTARTGGMLGGIALGTLADVTTLTTAIVVGAVILAAPAPLYLLAGRASRPEETEASALAD